MWQGRLDAAFSGLENPVLTIRKGENVMKKHGLRLLLTLCLATAFAVALGAVPAATESPPWYEMETAGDAYEFPITPEKTPEEWGKLRSLKKKLEVCQVPEEILETMSTEGLIETCLAYPLFSNMMYQNSLQDGFCQLVDGFNGLRELLSREDGAPLLLQKYLKLSLDNVKNVDEFGSIRLIYFEFMLANPQVISKLSEEEKEALLDRAMKLIALKSQRYAETFSVTSSALVASQVLLEDTEFAAAIEDNLDWKVFLGDGFGLTPEMLQTVQQFNEKREASRNERGTGMF